MKEQNKGSKRVPNRKENEHTDIYTLREGATGTWTIGIEKRGNGQNEGRKGDRKTQMEVMYRRN
jgi:hypothetical protein